MKNSDIRFAFFGTPRFSVRVLDALEARGLLPALVITAPDKPRGRGMEMQPSPAKAWALKRGIDVIAPATLKEVPPELLNTEWDCFCVAAYAKLLSKTVLDLPRKGSLNVHPSLLPKFRGPSPALSAILADERTSGVSIMLMSEKMDAGDILAQARIEIPEEEWPLRGSVFLDLLATEGGNLLAETMPLWLAGKITPEPQDEAAATYTKKFGKEDGRIDLTGEVRSNFLKIRAFDASAFDHSLRAWALFERGGKELRVLIADAEWKDGALTITRVIPEGKKEMDYADFLRSGARPRN